MPNDHRPFDENEWTTEERARVAALSERRVPPPELKQLTIGTLRREGYIGGSRRRSTWIAVGGLLAASLVFAAGALFGYLAASRRAIQAPPPSVATTRSVAQLDSAANQVTPTRHVVWY
jgi:hypothetical protein